jgi:hypothetical protein
MMTGDVERGEISLFSVTNEILRFAQNDNVERFGLSGRAL